jgi:HK97 gp10 family phage protein
MVERVKIEGLKELQTALQELPKATARNVMRRILKARGKPIAEAARKHVPVDQGDLKDSIAVSTTLSKRQKRMHRKPDKDDVEVYVGPGPHPQAHWLEFGTDERTHASGKSVGDVPKKPFMRPAWDSQRRGLLVGIKTDLWAEIKKAADRLARKAAKAKS